MRRRNPCGISNQRLPACPVLLQGVQADHLPQSDNIGSMGLLRWIYRAEKRRLAANRRAELAKQRAAVKSEQIFAAGLRRTERNDRKLQLDMEKLVRTRLRNQRILDQRAGLPIDPARYQRTSDEVTAEAKAIIRQAQRQLIAQGMYGSERREGESAADWLARSLKD